MLLTTSTPVRVNKLNKSLLGRVCRAIGLRTQPAPLGSGSWAGCARTSKGVCSTRPLQGVSGSGMARQAFPRPLGWVQPAQDPSPPPGLGTPLPMYPLSLGRTSSPPHWGELSCSRERSKSLKHGTFQPSICLRYWEDDQTRNWVFCLVVFLV